MKKFSIFKIIDEWKSIQKNRGWGASNDRQMTCKSDLCAKAKYFFEKQIKRKNEKVVSDYFKC